MIYIRTEDSKDGFQLCKKIKDIYFSVLSQVINIESLKGIFNLKDKIESIIDQFNNNDILLIVYDNIIENPLVSSNIKETIELIQKKNIEDRVIWIPTLSFELEILTIMGIEFICDIEEYNKFFRDLRKLYIKSHNINELTNVSKADSKYNEMYNKVKKEKLRNRVYNRLNEADFERVITIESISKQIMAKVFMDGDIRPIRTCWVNDCCHKKGKCRYEGMLNIQRIKECERSGSHLYKLRVLIHETAFCKLIYVINNILGIHIEEEEKTDFLSLLHEEILSANFINNLVIDGGQV